MSGTKTTTGRPVEHQVRPRPLREKVVSFDPVAVHAPFLLRCGALAVDYIVIVAFPVLFLLLSRLSGNDGAALINSELNNIGWLLGILVGFSNLIALPMISGRTIGKFATRIRIVSNDGGPVPFTSILLRQTVGYLLTIASGGIGFIVGAFSSKGRALHDYLFGTVVIYAEKQKRTNTRSP